MMTYFSAFPEKRAHLSARHEGVFSLNISQNELMIWQVRFLLLFQ